MITFYVLTIIFAMFISDKYFPDMNRSILYILFGLPSVSFLLIEEQVAYQLFRVGGFEKLLIISALLIKASKELYNLANGNEGKSYNYLFVGSLLVLSFNNDFLQLVIMLGISIYYYLDFDDVVKINYKVLINLFMSLVLINITSISIYNGSLIFLFLAFQMVVLLKYTKKADILMLIVYLIILNRHIDMSKYQLFLLSLLPLTLFLVLGLDEKIANLIVRKAKKYYFIDKFLTIIKLRRKFEIKLSPKRNIFSSTGQSQKMIFHSYRSDTVISATFLIVALTIIVSIGIQI